MQGDSMWLDFLRSSRRAFSDNRQTPWFILVCLIAACPVWAGPVGQEPTWIEAMNTGSRNERLRLSFDWSRLPPDRQQAHQQLLEAVRSGDPNVRRSGVAALGDLGYADDAAVTTLLGALHDPDRVVVAHAAIALGKLGASVSPRLFQASFDGQRSPSWTGWRPHRSDAFESTEAGDYASAALILSGSSAIPFLRAVGVAEARARVAAAAAGVHDEITAAADMRFAKIVAILQGIGDPALPVLEEWLSMPPPVQRDAQEALLAVGPRGCAALTKEGGHLDQLLRRLKDPHDEVLVKVLYDIESIAPCSLVATRRAAPLVASLMLGAPEAIRAQARSLLGVWFGEAGFDAIRGLFPLQNAAQADSVAEFIVSRTPTDSAERRAFARLLLAGAMQGSRLLRDESKRRLREFLENVPVDAAVQALRSGDPELSILSAGALATDVAYSATAIEVLRGALVHSPAAHGPSLSAALSSAGTAATELCPGVKGRASNRSGDQWMHTAARVCSSSDPVISNWLFKLLTGSDAGAATAEELLTGVVPWDPRLEYRLLDLARQGGPSAGRAAMVLMRLGNHRPCCTASLISLTQISHHSVRLAVLKELDPTILPLSVTAELAKEILRSPSWTGSASDVRHWISMNVELAPLVWNLLPGADEGARLTNVMALGRTLSQVEPSPRLLALVKTLEADSAKRLAISNSEESTRLLILELGALGSLAKSSASLVTQYLNGNSSTIRLAAAASLQRIGDRDAAISLIWDRDPELRWFGVVAATATFRADPTANSGQVAIVTDAMVSELVDDTIIRFATRFRPRRVSLMSSYQETLPALPTLPAYSAWQPLSSQIYRKPGITQGDVCDWITTALQDNGFDTGLYAAADGFAIVSSIERIDDQGKPLPGNDRRLRGSLPLSGLADYLSRLFLAPPGHSRLFVFLVTSHASLTGVVDAEIRTLNNDSFLDGGRILPDAIREKLTNDTWVHILVYHFEKTLGRAQLLSPSALSFQTHLDQAGLKGRLAVIH